MPHFIIETTQQILDSHAEQLLSNIWDQALASKLFSHQAIKIRAKAFSHYLVGGEKQDFIHVKILLIEGRSVDQKSKLARSVVDGIAGILPEVEAVTAEIGDLDLETYCKKQSKQQ